MTVNAIAIVPRAHVGPGQRIGLALYPAASLLNHSCIPPTAFDFQVTLCCITAPVPMTVHEAGHALACQFFIVETLLVSLHGLHLQATNCTGVLSMTDQR